MVEAMALCLVFMALSTPAKGKILSYSLSRRISGLHSRRCSSNLLRGSAKRRRKTSGVDSASRRVQRMLGDEEEIDWKFLEEEEKAAKQRQIEAMRLARAAAKGLIKGINTNATNLPQSAKEMGLEDFGKARVVQWFPGHIHKAELALKDQLKMVDVVVEVRDSRIPLSTTHPKLGEWTKFKRRILVLNRMEAVSSEEKLAWEKYFAERGDAVFWTNGKEGKGITEVLQAAIKLSKPVNDARKSRGLLPRAPRVVVVGFPNVGKSALINRLTKKRIVDSAPKVGVTRQLRWVRLGSKDLNEAIDLLDTPGMLPMRQEDQAAAKKLAMCNVIGEASYLPSVIAEDFLILLRAMYGNKVLDRVHERYQIPIPEDDSLMHEFIDTLADSSFGSDKEKAGVRILRDYQNGKFGSIGLEKPEVKH